MSKFSGLGLSVGASARMIIVHPVTQQPLRNRATGEAAYVDIMSADSEAGRRHQRATLNKRLSARARKISAEEIEAENVELLVALMRDWRLVTLAGDAIDVPFAENDAREMLLDPNLGWLRTQIDAFAGDLGNFQTQTATTS